MKDFRDGDEIAEAKLRDRCNELMPGSRNYGEISTSDLLGNFHAMARGSWLNVWCPVAPPPPPFPSTQTSTPDLLLSLTLFTLPQTAHEHIR